MSAVCPCSQDGTIQHEVKLTGEVSTTLASPEDGTNPKHGEQRTSPASVMPQACPGPGMRARATACWSGAHACATGTPVLGA